MISSARRRLRAVPTGLWIFLLFTALGVLFTWPVAAHFTTHLPSDRGAPPVVSWILAWQGHALETSPSDLFNGPMFHPFGHTILLSEEMFGGVILAMPVWLITHSPPAMFNTLILLSFPIAAFGAYLLLREITGSRWAGMVAGIAFGFSMYRLTQIPFLHVALIAWLAYPPYFAHRFLRERKWRYAIGLAVTTWFQLTSSGHGALLLGLELVILIPVLAFVHRKALLDRRVWIGGAAAIAAVVVGMLPFVLPYTRLYEDNPQFRRDATEISYYSTSPGSYAIATERSETYKDQPFRELAIDSCGGAKACLDRLGNDRFFPGVVVLVLLVLALFVFIRPPPGHRAWLLGFAVITFVAGALALGTDDDLTGPYGVAYQLMPALDTIRVPGRITPLTMLGVAGMAGLGVAAAVRWLTARSQRLTRVVMAVVCIAMLVDVEQQPANAVKAPAIPKIYDLLADASSNAPILELPTTQFRFDEGKLKSDSTFYREVPYLYAQTRHWRPLVNGRSSNVPRGYIDTIRKMEDFPNRVAVRTLRRLGVGCVVVHRDRIMETHWKDIDDAFEARNARAIVYDDGVRFAIDVAELQPRGQDWRDKPGCFGRSGTSTPSPTARASRRS